MSRHVQNTDVSVLERRLRPIYDWLDSGNYKKALQECTKVLKKTPNVHCAKALKALTLHRMGKETEANEILVGIKSEKPTDEATLQAMTLCYREMQQLEKICELYETAVKEDPTNEEIHTHLFMSYVRIHDFKSQQQSAIALYKQKPKNPYYCWNVMSIVLQATRGEGATDKKKRCLLLSLAERMMKKFLDDNKIEAEQEVQLYIMILELQGKYNELLEILDGPLSEKLQCTNISQSKLVYLKKLKRWNEVNILCKNILNENCDKWDIWKDYINSVFELSDISQTNGEGDNHKNSENDCSFETADNTPEKCHEFICGIIENGVANNFLLRGPFLARFELCAKLQERHLCSTEVLGDTIGLFIEYFRKFGHKPCCVLDLKIYLKLLDSDKRTDLSAKLIKDVGISSTSVPQTADQMQRHIGALQLSRLCGSHRNLTMDHLKALVTAFTLHYQHGYQSYGKNLLPTDFGPSDNYAILAAHVLYDIAQQEDSSDSLVVALILMETVLKNSPTNFHVKLLALMLYHRLGVGLDANMVYCDLDIKHLQLDSLGYLHCGRLATTGLFYLCATHFNTTLKFFSSNYKDSTDHLTFSYKFGSFIKLEEFMDFRERLNNSLHYTMTAVDSIILSLLECSSLESLYNISPPDNKIDWENLRDNRDVNLFVSWEPELVECPIKNSQLVKDLFVQDKSFLKLRSQIPWAFSSAIEIVKSVDGTREKHIDNLKVILKDWKEETVNVLKASYKPISENSITYPLPSRLHGFIESPYLEVIGSFLELLIDLTIEESDKTSAIVKNIEGNLDSLVKFMLGKIVKVSNNFRENRKILEFAVNTLEIVCLSSVICMMCNELAKPIQNKKGKKKPNETKNRELINQVVNKLRTAMEKLGEALDAWCESNSVKDITNMLETLNLNANGDIIYRNIIDSYTFSNKEIQAILKSKIKLLSSLTG